MTGKSVRCTIPKKSQIKTLIMRELCKNTYFPVIFHDLI